MSNTARKISAIFISVFILLVAYYGTLLPMRKSQVFISTMQSLRSVGTIADIRGAFSTPFNIPSPIGQEELVRNSANVVLGVLQQTDKAQDISGLLDFVETSYRPIIERGRGMSFEQNLYILGALNELAFVKTRETKYFQASKNYYSEGLRLGPKRPQFLYGLFDIYRMEGNVDGVKKIGDQILSQWPDDERARAGLEEFLKKVEELTKGK